MEKLPTKSPLEMLGKISDKMKIERVEVKEPPVIKVDITTLDYVKLWAVSWFRNEAKAELSGKHSPLPFDLTGGFPVKTVIAVVGAIVSLIAVSC